MKTRFCPSPTGFMHLGNVRTALFSALLSKKNQGTFLIRIEDTDQSRSAQNYTDQLLLDLRWLKLCWQEGPEVGGNAGSYWQSQRSEIYQHYYELLENQNLIYPCFCSTEQLALSRKVQLSQGKPPRYAGTCRNLSAADVEKKLAQGLQPTLRFLVPPKTTVQFHDLVKGRQRFATDDIGDFIIRRADGTSAFFFCNAIDDALMGVTHVLRGEDHLTNTPRQILILQACKLAIPEYGHIALILNSDGGKLSKREGSKSIKELREIGYLPEALLNYMARLGHHYPVEKYMTLDELAENFSIDALSKSPARFDPKQLDYWQHEAVLHYDSTELWQWLGAEVNTIVPLNLREKFLETIRPNITFPQDGIHWAEIFFREELEYAAEKLKTIADAGIAFYQLALKALEIHGNDYPKIAATLQQELHVKGKTLFMPLRAALTNELHGPELAKIFELLGSDKIKRRLEAALTYCSE